MNAASRLTTPDLIMLRNAFRKQGFDIRFVGGCVRDTLLGKNPHDVDLHTDATPEEATAIYQNMDLRWIPTGIDHGTVTVVLANQTYEITSLRRDVSTDGRRAAVEYTRDWRADAERRDFTINSMSMSLDGELYDPFDGLRDLRSGVVRFVGNPAERIREDYLRILRLYRFTGRFGKEVDADARRAVCQNRTGLDSISVERVWSEMRRIISGPHGPSMVNELYENLWGVKVLGQKWPDFEDLHDAHSRTQDPVSLMAVGWKLYAPHLLIEWKASRDEIDQCRYLASMIKGSARDSDPYREMAVYNVSREWALELAAIQNLNALERAMLAYWQVPECPVNGDDLIALGVKPGKDLGNMLKQARDYWADNNFRPLKQDLLDWVMTKFNIKQE